MTTRGGLQGRPLFDALHKRCRVWWPLEAQWYSGTVAHWMAAAPSGEPAAVGVVCGGRGWFLLVYDDGEHEWLQLPDSTVVIGSRAALPALPSCPPKVPATPAIARSPCPPFLYSCRHAAPPFTPRNAACP